MCWTIDKAKLCLFLNFYVFEMVILKIFGFKNKLMVRMTTVIFFCLYYSNGDNNNSQHLFVETWVNLIASIFYYFGKQSASVYVAINDVSRVCVYLNKIKCTRNEPHFSAYIYWTVILNVYYERMQMDYALLLKHFSVNLKVVLYVTELLLFSNYFQTGVISPKRQMCSNIHQQQQKIESEENKKIKRWIIYLFISIVCRIEKPKWIKNVFGVLGRWYFRHPVRFYYTYKV